MSKGRFRKPPKKARTASAPAPSPPPVQRNEHAVESEPKNAVASRWSRFWDAFEEFWDSAFFPVLMSVLLLMWVYAKGEDHGPSLQWFLWAENFVLAVMAGISTHNYQSTKAKVKSLSSPDSRKYRLTTLMLFNAFLFSAVVYFTDPTPRLSFIVLIYATFSLSNIIQVANSVHITEGKRRAIAMLEASGFLRAENGPTMLAYASMLVLIVLYSHRFPSQHPYLEAFSGGVAAFHLGLSVVRYALAIGRGDPLDKAMNTVEWTEGALATLAVVPGKNQKWKWSVATCCAVVVGVLVLHFVVEPSIHTGVVDKNVIKPASKKVEMGTIDDGTLLTKPERKEATPATK